LISETLCGVKESRLEEGTKKQWEGGKAGLTYTRRESPSLVVSTDTTLCAVFSSCRPTLTLYRHLVFEAWRCRRYKEGEGLRGLDGGKLAG
jgi:hypothetical protein